MSGPPLSPEESKALAMGKALTDLWEYGPMSIEIDAYPDGKVEIDVLLETGEIDDYGVEETDYIYGDPCTLLLDAAESALQAVKQWAGERGWSDPNR